MVDLKSQIDIKKLPRHIAVIMDGNGRWAKMRGMHRLHGHRNGVKAVRETTEACAELGVEFLTLYAFSTENWSRPLFEVNALMGLLVDTLHKEIETLKENNIRLQSIGAIDQLPKKTYKALLDGIRQTRHHNRMTLVLAINYSSRWEILEAVKKLNEDVQKKKIDPGQTDIQLFSKYLATRDYPDPELLIRTSGEQRVSNFLLWQIAYSELYFTKTYWPDFNKEELYKAILDYQQRERRFGKIKEQLV